MTETPTTNYFPPPRLRVSASYPASDGTAPESIDIEINAGVPITGHLIRELVSALAAVPDHRYAVSPYLHTTNLKEAHACGQH